MKEIIRSGDVRSCDMHSIHTSTEFLIHLIWDEFFFSSLNLISLLLFATCKHVLSRIADTVV